MYRKSEEKQEKLIKAMNRLKQQGYTGAQPLKNDLQEKFCQEYLVDLNVKQAGLRAGYEGPPYVNMENPRILLRIEYLKKQRQLKTNLQQQMVIEELKNIAFSNILDFVEVIPEGIQFNTDMNDKSGDLYKKGVAIQELSAMDGKTQKVGIKLYDKIQALDKLMKHMDLYERAKLEIEREKLELMKLKNAPQEAVEVGDDGFMEAMDGMADDKFDNIDIDLGEDTEEDD